MDKIRLGIIGMGNMGRSHASYINEGVVQNLEMTAICDVADSNLEWARQQYPKLPSGAFYSNTEKFLKEAPIDAVLICTPHYDHPALAIAAFDLGKHVLCEKPTGVYTKQIRELNEASKKTDKVFGVMFQRRTSGRMKKVKELIDSGELGEITRVQMTCTYPFRSQIYYDQGAWRGTWDGEGGGVLMNQCPHDLDLFQWFFGLPKRVRAFCYFGKHHDIDVEDDVTAFMEFANGATGLFIASTGEIPGKDTVEISGDKGMIVAEEGGITFLRTRASVKEHCANSKNPFDKGEVWRCEIPSPKDPSKSSHAVVTQSWVDAILRGTPMIAHGTEGLNSVELANSILLSTWIDNWVDLPLDDDYYYAELQKRIEHTATRKRSLNGKVEVDMEASFRS